MWCSNVKGDFGEVQRILGKCLELQKRKMGYKCNELDLVAGWQTGVWLHVSLDTSVWGEKLHRSNCFPMWGCSYKRPRHIDALQDSVLAIPQVPLRVTSILKGQARPFQNPDLISLQEILFLLDLTCVLKLKAGTIIWPLDGSMQQDFRHNG